MGKSVILFLAALILGLLVCWVMVLLGEHIFKISEMQAVGIMLGAAILAGTIAGLFK